MAVKKQDTINVLLVEDNEGDILLTRETFAEIESPVNLHVVKDGEEAISFMMKEEQFSDAITPDLILLDLNIPKVNGFDILQKIKKTPNLKLIPIIVLSTSNKDKDILDSYKNYVNCYITKPVDLNEFAEIIQNIEKFWFKTVKLPTLLDK